MSTHYSACFLLLAAPSFAGDLQVHVTGSVTGGLPPSSGPLAGATIGDPVDLRFEINFPASGSGGQAFTWMDNPTFQLQVGAGTDVHRYPAGGLCWWIDDVLGIDGIHLRGEALGTTGLRIEMRLEDSSAGVFDSPDPLLHAGTYDASTFDDVVWELRGSSSLIFAFQDVTITPIDVGNSYCGPAVLNSSGSPATARAIGSDRVLGRRLRVIAQGLPVQTLGYWLTSQSQGFVPMAGGSQGTLCLGGSIGRYAGNVLNSGADGTMALDVEIAAIPQPNGSVSAVVGSTWNFQAWFRDANPAVTSNFTDGVSVMFR